MPMTELHAEHKQLSPEIERLRSAAELLGAAQSQTGREAVRGAYEFLTKHLIPHAEAEDHVLYPEVAKVMGASEATQTMSRDHVMIGHLTRELEELQEYLGHNNPEPWAIESLRRVLYGLYAVVKLHFAKEEEIYLPLLERSLTPAAAQALAERMSRFSAARK